MKKLLFALLIAASLVACTRDADGFLPYRPVEDWYFSRVRYNSQARGGSIDTIWTIRIVGDSMRETFEGMNGYVYDDHGPDWIEIGRLWEKRR